MLLYTCGCSFTYGEELKDKQNSWPNKLGKLLQASEVINTATCSASNEYIQRNVVDFILSNNKKSDDIFVAVGWTSDIRWEGYIDNPIQTYVQLKVDRHVQYTHPKESRIYLKKEIDLLIPNFIQTEYNRISNDFLLCFKGNKHFNFYNKLKHILLTHCFLDMMNIKHIFFNSLIEIHDKQTQLLDAIKFLKNIKQIQNKFKDYYIINPTMEEYSQAYPLAPLKHPLEEGHDAWAKYLYEYIKEKNIL